MTLAESTDRLLGAIAGVAVLRLPLFPNTYMLQHAMASAHVAVEPAIWNEMSIVDLAANPTLAVTIATRENLQKVLENGQAHEVAHAPITSFHPRYLYVTRHLQFPPDSSIALDRGQIAQLASDFSELVLFGDTHEQTKAVARLLQDWVGRVRVFPVTPRFWEPGTSVRPHSMIRLEAYYMSPLRRVSLEQSRERYLRLELPKDLLHVFDEAFSAKFETHVVVTGGRNEGERQRVALAIAAYYEEVFDIAGRATRPNPDLGAVADLEAPWAVYGDLVRANLPTAAPESPQDFARLLSEHHDGVPPYAQ